MPCCLPLSPWPLAPAERSTPLCCPPLQGTWPTGIQAPLMDEGPFECLDYVYVWAAPGYRVK